MKDGSADVLRQEWLETYEFQLNVLWFQSVELNSRLFLLEKIAEFPFAVFAQDDRLFWRLAADAFYESSVMAIWRIAGDPSNDALTLRRFRNELVKNTVDGQAKEAVLQRLRHARFDERIRRIVRGATQLRNDWIAHLKREAVRKAHEEQRGMPIIPLKRLKAACDAVNEMIAALTLEGSKAPSYMEYLDTVQHPPDMDPRPDIEKILDHLANISPALRRPEGHPELWKAMWDGLSAHERQQFNKYRERHGLEPYDG